MAVRSCLVDQEANAIKEGRNRQPSSSLFFLLELLRRCHQYHPPSSLFYPPIRILTYCRGLTPTTMPLLVRLSSSRLFPRSSSTSSIKSSPKNTTTTTEDDGTELLDSSVTSQFSSSGFATTTTSTTSSTRTTTTTTIQQPCKSCLKVKTQTESLQVVSIIPNKNTNTMMIQEEEEEDDDDDKDGDKVVVKGVVVEEEDGPSPTQPLHATTVTESGPSQSACTTTTNNNNNNTTTTVSRRPTVRFSTSTFYSHALILGDNPSVSSGPPLSIHWHAFDVVTIPVEDYDTSMDSSSSSSLLTTKRTKSQLAIPREVREDWLRHLGVSRHELVTAIRQVQKVKQQRSQSAQQALRQQQKQHGNGFWQRLFASSSSYRKDSQHPNETLS